MVSVVTYFSLFDALCVLIVQYSVFGSIFTIGAMIGAIVSGRIADYIGRRGVSFIAQFNLFHIFNSRQVINLKVCTHLVNQTMGFSEIFCTIGWLAIVFSKVPSSLYHSLSLSCFSRIQSVFWNNFHEKWLLSCDDHHIEFLRPIWTLYDLQKIAAKWLVLASLTNNFC